jgi:hypothetical protein
VVYCVNQVRGAAQRDDALLPSGRPPRAPGGAGNRERRVRLALTVLILALLTGAAAAQWRFDAKGRRYQCLQGDWSCSVLPPPGAPLQPLPERRTRSDTARPPYVPCGSRCELLDRMK